MYKLCHFYIPRIQELQGERDVKDVGKLEREMGYGMCDHTSLNTRMKFSRIKMFPTLIQR